MSHWCLQEYRLSWSLFIHTQISLVLLSTFMLLLNNLLVLYLMQKLLHSHFFKAWASNQAFISFRKEQVIFCFAISARFHFSKFCQNTFLLNEYSLNSLKYPELHLYDDLHYLKYHTPFFWSGLNHHQILSSSPAYPLCPITSSAQSFLLPVLTLLTSANFLIFASLQTLQQYCTL